VGQSTRTLQVKDRPLGVLARHVGDEALIPLALLLLLVARPQNLVRGEWAELAERLDQVLELDLPIN